MFMRLVARQRFPSRYICQHVGFMPMTNAGYSTISNLPSSPTEPTEPKSIKDRMKQFFKQYGKLGVGVYLGVSLVTLSSSYLAIRSGLDVPGLLVKIGVPEKDWMKNAGTFAFAYALYKLALPLRLFVTVGLTGYISRRFRIGNAYKSIDQSPKAK